MAGNRVEALAGVARRRYDVVPMDVQMPEMDGHQASRQLYPRAIWPRIIAMTANAMAGDREPSLEAGMDDYLNKPIRVDALADALERCASFVERSAAT